ncbi:MAG: hypothetical protein PHC75_06960 [Burkholderiales bacterium]|nr:hypothetical protein [Burkholderiales bacterium]
MKIDKYKNQGFTIYELVVTIAILVIISPFIYSLINEAIQRKYASQYADFTKLYAGVFINEIKTNYNEYYESAINNPNNDPIVIKFSKVKGNIPNSLNWGILPCVSLKYNNVSREMQAIMFYTNNVDHDKNISRKITQQLGVSAMNKFGAGSAYYESSGVVNGIGGSWGLQKENNYLDKEHVDLCDTHQLTKNGLVINLNMLDGFPRKDLSVDNGFLSRVKDTGYPLGDSTNKNTMQTDIIMQNGKNFFGIFASGYADITNVAEQIYIGIIKSVSFNGISKKKSDNLYSNSDSLVVTSSLSADSFLSNLTADYKEACTKEHLGMIAKQKSSNVINEYNDLYPGYLICSHDKLLCNTSNHYCFLPPSQSIHFVFKQPRETFTCPKNMFIDSGSVKTVEYEAKNMPIWTYASNDFPLYCIFNNGQISVVPQACRMFLKEIDLLYGDKIGDNVESGVLYSSVSIVKSINVPDKTVYFEPNQDRQNTIISCSCDGRYSNNWDKAAINQAFGGITELTCSSDSITQHIYQNNENW